MTDEQRVKALDVFRASRERSAALREKGTVGVKPTTIDDEKSHSAVLGTLESVGVGAKESAKNTVFNAKSVIKTDALGGKSAGLETATKAVESGVDYDSFMDEMRKKYGKAQTFWAIKMSPEERDIWAGVLQAKKLGIDSSATLAEKKAEVQGKLDSIEQERLDRSLRSQAALQAVDDKYELGKVGEFAQDTGGAFGQMLPSMVVGAISPAAGVASFGVQAGLQGYGQARDEGASYEDAMRYGVATGVMEAGIEKATGGMGKVFGKGFLDKAIKMQPNTSKKAVLANALKGAAGEGAEEAVSGFLDPYLQRATYDPEAENASASELAYQAAIGAALGGMLGGTSNALEYRSSKKASEKAEAEKLQSEKTKTQAQRVSDKSGSVSSFRNIDYTDKAQQTAIMQDVNREMVQDGRVVVADSNMLKELEEYYPDLRSMKSKDRKPILKAKMNALKEKLKKDLTALKDTTFEFNVNDGVLEAKLYDTGIKEVLEKITKQKAAMISSSEDIFKNAKYMYSTQDYEGNPNIERWNYFYTPVKIGDDVVGVRIAVRDMYTPKESQIYNWGIKKEATLDGAGRLPNGSIPSDVSSVTSTSTIPQQESTVNAYAKAYEQMVNNSANAESQGKARELSEDEKRVKRFIKTAALNARLDVKYKDMPTAQKAYYKDGTIYINANRSLNEGMKSTVAHEIFHSLEGSKEHDKIVELALQSMGDGAIQRKIDSYGKYGIKLDEDGAKAEIGAEYIEKALTDEATINQILLENKSLAGRIWERIKDLIAFYKAKKSMTAEEAREYKALLKAKRLYEEGLAKLNSGEYEPYSGERNARYQSERMGGYFPDNEVSIKDVEQYKIKNINNKYEVISKLKQVLAKTYLSTEKQSKPIINLDTGMEIEIRQGGINETFGKDEYYLNLSNEEKLAKIATMSKLANLIKYGEVRAEEAANYHNPNSKVRYVYLTAPIKVDGKEYVVNMDIRKSPNGENRFYIHSLDIKKDAESLLPSMRVVKGEKQTSINNVPDTAENVNTQNARFSIDEQTDSPQFKAWFGDSKVVDDEGKPKVVYHGTYNDFTEFKRGDIGFHFGSKEQANDRIRVTGNARVIPAYLSIKNPLYIGMDYGDWNAANVAIMLIETEVFEYHPKQQEIEERLEDILAIDSAKGRETASQRRNRELRELLQSLGYDGIIYENAFEGDRYSGNNVSYIALEPTQIKSAIGNRGTFDVKKADIRYSIDESADSEVGKYDYDTLIKKPDMKVTLIGEHEIPTKGKKLDKGKIVAESKKSANKLIYNGYEQNYVYVDDIKGNVLYSRDGIEHGLLGNKTKTSTMETAEITYDLPEILRNSIVINERLARDERNPNGSYEMIGYGEKADGTGYIVKSIINKMDANKSVLADIEIYNVLKGARAKKIGVSSRAATLTNSGQLPHSSRTSPNMISVAELLDIVKDNYPEILSRDVLRRFNKNDVEQEQGIRYSVDENVSASQGSSSLGKKVGYRFFDNTFQNTPIFDDAVKEIERSYEHERSRVSEKENIAEARQRLRDNGWYKEINTVLRKNSVDGADTDVAMAIIAQLNNYEPDSAEFGRIMKFAEDYADKTVESGQFIQSLAKYARTPVGKTEKAMRDIKREERKVQESNPKQWNDTEKKATGAKNAYKEAQEEAANEAVGKVADEIADSIDIGSAEKVLNKDATLSKGLAAKIQSYITPNSDTVDNAKLQRDIINELFKLAKESPLPDKAINVQKKDYVKILREILHNQEKYEDVWQEARESLGRRYKNDPEKMQVLEDYFNNYIVPVYSESSMREALRGVMKEMGLDTKGFSLSNKKNSGAEDKKAVQDILLASREDKAKAREDIQKILAERLGLDDLDKQAVDVVTNNILSTYDKMLKAKAEKKLSKFLDTEVKEQTKRDSLKKQMLRMVRNGTFGDDEATRIIRKAYDVPTLTTKEVSTILNYYERADEFAEGSYDRRKWESKAQKIIEDKIPKTLSEKNNALRRIAMLTNPATWERNTFGNVVFGAAEMIKNVPAGIIDAGIAKFTGKRTTSMNILADVGAYAKGAKKGAVEWGKDLVYGVDTSHQAVREEYQGTGNTFNDAHLPGKIANKAETVMSKALQIGDRPFYEGAYNQRINELKRLGYDVSLENIQAEAKIYALERTFQNDSKISTALTKVRNELGLFGHFLVPFTQTPGNLLDKCIDYSGAGGLARALYQLGAAEKTGKFDQKLFVDRIGRALTGLGVMVLGAALKSAGHLVGTDEDDYKLMGAKRLAGEKEYSLRIGDTYYTIDWAQPVSAVLIAGAEAFDAGMEQDDWMQVAIASGEGVINTLFAMSCLEGLESMMSSYQNAEPADKIADVFISGVSQYFPTALRRLNNVIDPIQRQTYDANPIIKQAKYIASGVPVASRFLEPKYTLEGDVQYKSQGRNTATRAAENFISAGNVSRRYYSKVNDELLRIYEKTGETKQFLHYADKKLDYGDGGKYVLSSSDYNRMQKEIGTNTTKAMSTLMKSSVYKSMSDDEKAEALADVANFYDNKFKNEYAKDNKITYNDKSYQSLKAKIDKYGWPGYFEIKRDFKKEDGSSINFEVAVKRKETCDKYGIKYDSYNSTVAKVDAIKEKNKNRYTKVSDKTEANKRDVAKYLSTLDLTDPQRQVLWKEIGGYDGKNSETYKSVARRYGF